MESAPAFFDFYLAHLVGDHDVNTERGRREITQAMGLMVRKAKDSVLLDDSIQKTAFAIGASAEAVRAEFQRIKVPVNKLSQISEPTKDVAELQIDPPHNGKSGCFVWCFTIARLVIGQRTIWIADGLFMRKFDRLWMWRLQTGRRLSRNTDR